MTRKERNTARIVGALFLIALVASILGGALIDSVLSAEDFYGQAAASETQLVIAILLELINGLAVIFIAVLLFPVLRRYDEGTALGYVAMRVVESAVIIAAVIGPLTIVALSQEYAAAGPAEAADLHSVGAAMIAVRERLVGQLTGIFFSLGALLLYYLLYQSRIVPRFISLWGLIAVALVLSWNLLEMFDLHIEAGIIFGLPIILNELLLAIWLIAKGFDASAELFEPAGAALGKA